MRGNPVENWTQIIEQLSEFNRSHSLADQAFKTAIALIVGLMIWFIIRLKSVWSISN